MQGPPCSGSRRPPRAGTCQACLARLRPRPSGGETAQRGRSYAGVPRDRPPPDEPGRSSAGSTLQCRPGRVALIIVISLQVPTGRTEPKTLDFRLTSRAAVESRGNDGQERNCSDRPARDRRPRKRRVAVARRTAPGRTVAWLSSRCVVAHASRPRRASTHSGMHAGRSNASTARRCIEHEKRAHPGRCALSAIRNDQRTRNRVLSSRPLSL